MRKVSIIGVGQTKYGNLKDKTLRDLIAEAGCKAIEEANIKKNKIEAFYFGNYDAVSFIKQNHLAPYGAGAIGLKYIPCIHVEGACCSGALALREGMIAIAAGLYDIVLVTGAEKMNTRSTEDVTEVLAQAGDYETELLAGATFPSAFGMIARRHMYQYGTKREHLAAVAVKNHSNGAKNPDAHMQKEISFETVMGCDRMVADPLTIYDCSLISDGASAVVLCATELASSFSKKPVHILSIGQASDSFSIHLKNDITTFDATVKAANQAYKIAGLKPSEIDVAEVHDCFTIAEIIAIEDLGFVKKGEGGEASFSGLTSLCGDIPVNPSGGLKSKGHPVGATGVGQIVEIVRQIRNEAGLRQVKEAETGLAHNFGGSGATAVVTILGKSTHSTPRLKSRGLLRIGHSAERSRSHTERSRSIKLNLTN